MGDELVIVRRFSDRMKADLARQTLVDQGLRCEVTSTRTTKNGHPTEFGLLLDRNAVGRADDLLGPEPLPDARSLRQGERSLQIALGVFGIIALVWLTLFLLRR